MAKWTDLGHAMRRRMGAPSSHLEAAGKSMTRNHMTPEEVIASAEHANSARRYMSMDAAKSASPVMPERGTAIAKKNTQASDPTSGGKANRKNISAGNAVQSERMGAKFRVTASVPSVDPAAGPTMANAKTVPSVMGQSGNFDTGMNSAR
jgi:hypothetical protein